MDELPTTGSACCHVLYTIVTSKDRFPKIGESMHITMFVAARLCIVGIVALVAALVVLISTSQSEASSQGGISSNYSAGGASDGPRAHVGKPMTASAEPLPVSCQEAQAYAAQFGPKEAVREARKRKLTWAQIKRVKSECFDRNA
ncbi:MAG: hypothetical protein HXX10_02220 [Rhodoplanes sp.]|uniref:hypothetical protein n=1 Tax=Rhodoplanes sp. TaxID=1968906 RepID=UPI00183A9591|nr:hypothetical protein [Rhodoplanes sp.]NVO12830.1 hypothetical protein [Rhodoplanes sp.]